MLRFYKKHVQYLTEAATKPDERRMAFAWEGPRHFIDLDVYSSLPPRRWEEALTQYSEDTLLMHGILPWHLQKEFWSLVEAFRRRDPQKILRLSAEFGHYLADAHVPLHTTSNYNGQKTGQYGIHGLWEGRLPETFGEGYDYYVGRAYFISSIADTVWGIVLESHGLVEWVFQAERLAGESISPDKKYSFEGQSRVYSLRFRRLYASLLEGMVENRMRLAIRRLGSFWYSAWVVAGKPNLDSLLGVPAPEQEKYFRDEKVQDDRCFRFVPAGEGRHGDLGHERGYCLPPTHLRRWLLGRSHFPKIRRHLLG